MAYNMNWKNAMVGYLDFSNFLDMNLLSDGSVTESAPEILGKNPDIENGLSDSGAADRLLAEINSR